MAASRKRARDQASETHEITPKRLHVDPSLKLKDLQASFSRPARSDALLSDVDCDLFTLSTELPSYFTQESIDALNKFAQSLDTIVKQFKLGQFTLEYDSPESVAAHQEYCSLEQQSMKLTVSGAREQLSQVKEQAHVKYLEWAKLRAAAKYKVIAQKLAELKIKNIFFKPENVIGEPVKTTLVNIQHTFNYIMRQLNNPIFILHEPFKAKYCFENKERNKKYLDEMHQLEEELLKLQPAQLDKALLIRKRLAWLAFERFDHILGFYLGSMANALRVEVINKVHVKEDKEAKGKEEKDVAPMSCQDDDLAALESQLPAIDWGYHDPEDITEESRQIKAGLTSAYGRNSIFSEDPAATPPKMVKPGGQDFILMSQPKTQDVADSKFVSTASSIKKRLQCVPVPLAPLPSSEERKAIPPGQLQLSSKYYFTKKDKESFASLAGSLDGIVEQFEQRYDSTESKAEHAKLDAIDREISDSKSSSETVQKKLKQQLRDQYIKVKKARMAAQCKAIADTIIKLDLIKKLPQKIFLSESMQEVFERVRFFHDLVLRQLRENYSFSLEDTDLKIMAAEFAKQRPFTDETYKKNIKSLMNRFNLLRDPKATVSLNTLDEKHAIQMMIMEKQKKQFKNILIFFLEMLAADLRFLGQQVESGQMLSLMPPPLPGARRADDGFSPQRCTI